MESKYSPFNIAIQAKGMRDSQKLYFELAKKAKTTRLPEDRDAARKVLDISKKQEISFDDTINEILNGQ